MTRQKVSRDAVIVAIDAIRHKGDEPSINKVLEITGGSKTTVAAIMREINAEAEAAPKVAEFPAAVVTAMEQAAGGIWAAAQAAAKEQFDVETRRFLTRTTRLETDIADLATLTDIAEAERDEALISLENLKVLREEDAKAREVMEERIRALEARHIEDEERHAALAVECNEARAEVEMLTDMSALLERDLVAAKQEAAHASTQLHAQREIMNRLETLLASRLQNGAPGENQYRPADVAVAQ